MRRVKDQFNLLNRIAVVEKLQPGAKILPSSVRLQHPNRRIDANIEGYFLPNAFEQFYIFFHSPMILQALHKLCKIFTIFCSGEKAFCGRKVQS